MLARPDEPAPRKEAGVRRLEREFRELLDACSRFSREIVQQAGWNGHSGAVPDRGSENVAIARAVFGKWSLDILTLLYLHHEAGFQEMRRELGRISSRVLSTKLKRMQDTGLIRRDVKPTHPPRVAYSLTERGLMVAKLGEPVFLYLRLSNELAEAGGSAASE